MKRWIQLIWLHFSAGIQTIYLIIRYGVSGTEKRLSAELKDIRRLEDELRRNL